MALLVAPYTNAMRLGQGFNSYTQQICVDDAVVIDPNRAENVITNDGTTMRIVAESSGKPSVWNRIKEVVKEGPVAAAKLLEAAGGDDDYAIVSSSKAQSGYDADAAAEETDAGAQAAGVAAAGDEDESAEEASGDAEAQAADDSGSKEEEGETADADGSGSESAVDVAKEDTPEIDDTEEKAEAENSDTARKDDEKASTEDGDEAPADEESIKAVAATSTSATGKADPKKAAAEPEKPAGPKSRLRSSSVGNKQENAKSSNTGTTKAPSTKFQVKEIPKRGAKDVVVVAQKPAGEVELEQARLDKQERLEMIKLEKERMREQRDYQRKLEIQAREEERERQAEEREEQRQIRKEKREYEAVRRAAAQKAIAEAVAAKKDALTLEDLNKIKAQNQFADRFEGMATSDEKYNFDASGARGPSQTVTYSSRFIDRLSDVTEDMAISGALSVKMAKIGGSGRGSFVDSDKFKESDLNFYISVKVVNQTVNFKDALVYNPMRSVGIGSDDFNKVYGDSFISGFQEGGEFNAIISMKVHNKAKLLDIQAEAKVALTAGPVDITAEANVGIARTNLEMNTETTIQVSWCGGGHIKPMEQPWNIQSVMQAAARFPSLVADCPQRTHAILTKYESLRSFVSLKPAQYSPLQYENAQIYTNVLMDAFMSYKSLYKKLGDDVYRIQSKTLEIEPWTDANDGKKGEGEVDTPSKSRAITAMGQAAASGDQNALVAAKRYAAALTAALDTSRFDASLAGFSDARKFIRRQMVFIVNEVDQIEKDPKLATDEDHEEPFQAPLLFETRLPVTKVPDALKPKSDPLSGRRIMAKTQTEEDLKQEQIDQERLENDSPALYQMDQDLTMAETTSLDEIKMKSPGIGRHLQVSRATPNTEKGDFFNNLEFLFPEWQVESITIGITKWGCVGSVEVVYENGLLLRKGLPAANLTPKTLSNFQPGERITSAAIEVGVPTIRGDQKAEDAVRVLSVCMYTNRGRRLLGQAIKNEVLAGDRVKKDNIEYEQIKTVFLDSAFSRGTFKGFFGRISMDESTNGGILRLGVIWGDSSSTKLSTTVREAAPVYDTDAIATDAAINAAREERDQARKEIQLAKEQANREIEEARASISRDVDAARQNFEHEKAQAIENAKQIRFNNGVHTGRHSVSFRGDTFRVSPSDTPFLIFENGNRFVYQPDGNLVVYAANGHVQWAMNRYGPGAAELIYHGGNDGNLVAWKNGGATWATETQDCRNGFLVFSSEAPFLEIFREDGVRRCNYP